MASPSTNSVVSEHFSFPSPMSLSSARACGSELDREQIRRAAAALCSTSTTPGIAGGRSTLVVPAPGIRCPGHAAEDTAQHWGRLGITYAGVVSRRIGSAPPRSPRFHGKLILFPADLDGTAVRHPHYKATQAGRPRSPAATRPHHHK
jgi:hypothetical protein